MQPRSSSSIEDSAAAGYPWACDNDAFTEFHEKRFRNMLDMIEGQSGCKFVVAPDVVGDSRATARLFRAWAPELARRELPVGLVAQDGLIPSRTPWGELAALFIGGTTEFKLGPAARRLIARALDEGLWVHMGRVNSLKRMRYAAALGCHSVDGTKFSRFPRVWLPKGLEWIETATREASGISRSSRP